MSPSRPHHASFRVTKPPRHRKHGGRSPVVGGGLSLPVPAPGGDRHESEWDGGADSANHFRRTMGNHSGKGTGPVRWILPFSRHFFVVPSIASGYNHSHVLQTTHFVPV